MCVYVSVCLSVRPFVFFRMYVCIYKLAGVHACMYVWLVSCLSVPSACVRMFKHDCLSVCLCASVPVCLSVCLSGMCACVCASVSLSVCMCERAYLSVCLSVCLSRIRIRIVYW